MLLLLAWDAKQIKSCFSFFLFWGFHLWGLELTDSAVSIWPSCTSSPQWFSPWCLLPLQFSSVSIVPTFFLFFSLRWSNGPSVCVCVSECTVAVSQSVSQSEHSTSPAVCFCQLGTLFLVLFNVAVVCVCSAWQRIVLLFFSDGHFLLEEFDKKAAERKSTELSGRQLLLLLLLICMQIIDDRTTKLRRKRSGCCCCCCSTWCADYDSSKSSSSFPLLTISRYLVTLELKRKLLHPTMMLLLSMAAATAASAASAMTATGCRRITFKVHWCQWDASTVPSFSFSLSHSLTFYLQSGTTLHTTTTMIDHLYELAVPCTLLFSSFPSTAAAEC